MSLRPLLLPVLLGLFTGTLGITATSVYLHRSLAHRALALQPATEKVARVIAWLTTGIRRREWVAVHRAHHRLSDTSLDPHSPHNFRSRGPTRLLFLSIVYYRR